MIPRAQLNEIPSYQASKWLKLPLLLTYEEMESLLPILPKYFVPLSGLISESYAILSKDQFLEIYKPFIDQILEGTKRPKIDPHLTFALTNDLNDLREVKVDGGVLHRIFKPVIQVQPYTLHYSETAEIFHDMTHSYESFYWGLVFSYPQIYNNPVSDEVEKVSEDLFPNTAYFKALQKWSRAHTVPSPFKVGEKLINVPARVGKQFIRGRPWMTLPQK